MSSIDTQRTQDIVTPSIAWVQPFSLQVAWDDAGGRQSQWDHCEHGSQLLATERWLPIQSSLTMGFFVFLGQNIIT